MSRERELIKRATEALKFWMDETAHSVDWELLEDLESYLASEKQDQPEPVAWLYSKGDVLAGVPVIFTSATTGKNFAFQEPHYDQKPLYLRPVPQRKFVWMNREKELLKQALEYLPTLSVTHKEISEFLSTPEPEPEQDEEPIYMFRRLGQDDYITCSKERFYELSEKDHMFQTKVIHPAPRPEFVRLSEEEIVMLAKRYDVWTHVIRAIEDALEEKNK